MKAVFTGVLMLMLVASLSTTVGLRDLDAKTIAALRHAALTADCVNCDDECGGGASGHVAASAGAGVRHGLPHPSVCGPGTCSEFHPTGCGGGETEDFDVAGSWTAASEGDREVIKDLLHRYPTRLRLNQERRALQWLDCRGQVTASLPIANQDVVALAE